MNGARIHERGYLRYEGARTGPAGALRTLILHSVRRLLGIKRGVRAKLLPVVVGAIAYLPAIVFVGVAAFVPRQITEILLPGSDQYLGFVMPAVYLFAALGAPAVLCPDRRHGTLALYLASPLTRDGYLAGRAVALLGFLAVVTVGPALVLLAGLSLLDAGPTGASGAVAELARAVAAGVLVAVLFAGLSLALASLTDRQVTAAGYVILWLLVSGAVVNGILIEALDAPDVAALLDVTAVATESVARIYGAAGEHPGLPAAAVLAAAAGWAGLTAWFTRWRYQRLQVTR